MNRFLLMQMLFLLSPGITLVAAERVIPRDAKVYIEEMQEDLDGYIRAEIVQKKVPIKIVLDTEKAEYILTGTATEEEKRKWHSGWLTPEQDRTSANVMLIDKASEEMVWAAEAGDRSLWWGVLARGGQRKVAGRLAKKLKRAVMKK